VIARFFYSDGSFRDVKPFGSVRGLSSMIGGVYERPARVEFQGGGVGEHQYRDWVDQCHRAVLGGQVARVADREFAVQLGEMERVADRKFAVQLGKMAKPYETWLGLMQFGMAKLESDQPLMIKLLCDRISQMVAGDRTQEIDVVTRKVLDDLGLQIVRKGGAK
jgi:hypothetical protein